MENLPLDKRLKREIHRKIAYAQDIILKEVYSVFDKAVLHGGTAIWRCYSGKRFSEDLDFYLNKDKKRIELFFENVKRRGFIIKKKKITERSIYSELEFERVSIRFETTFQNIKGRILDYEEINGNFIVIYSLSIEEFIVEKIKTYLNRLKIRDLWDIFFLLGKIKDPKSIKEINELIKNYKKPLDEENLKTIILEGVVPSSEEMINYIKRKWENKYI